MLEHLDVRCDLRPNELLSLVSNLPKLGNLAKLKLVLNAKLLEDDKSLSVLDCLQSCPLLKNVSLEASGFSTLEVPSGLFSALKPLLVNKLEAITLDSLVLNSSTAEALSRALQSQYCSLVTLTLHRCHLLSNASKQLAIGIGRNTSLHRVVFHRCQWDKEDFKVLADTLRDNKTLKEVEIKH